MSDRLYFSVPDECDNMLAQRFLRDKCGLSARIITRLKREKASSTSSSGTAVSGRASGKRRLEKRNI